MYTSSIRLGAVWLLPLLAATSSGSFVARRQRGPAVPAVTAAPQFDAGVLVQRQTEDITAISDCHAHGTAVYAYFLVQFNFRAH